MKVPPLPRQTGGPFFETYTRGLTTADIERLFTRDTPEAYRFFSRNIDFDALKKLPWHRRTLGHARLFFLAFTLKLTPARRAIYGIALLATSDRADGAVSRSPLPADSALRLRAGHASGCSSGFLLVNLLVLLEVADRLSLKNDLEIAREIQQAMLPRAAFKAPGIEAFGMTRPANTVGGDFYDILPLPDGRVLLALGDVAGKGSPAALLMALLLAMMRTLVDEGLEGADLVARLNAQIGKHAHHARDSSRCSSRCSTRRPESCRTSTPDRIRRCCVAGTDGTNACAPAAWRSACSRTPTYMTGATMLEPGDVLVMYSDGVTEAENTFDQPFDEAGRADRRGRPGAGRRRRNWAGRCLRPSKPTVANGGCWTT